MKRAIRWAWNYAITFAKTIGRRNDYFWPDRRAGIATAHLIGKAIAGACDGVWYSKDVTGILYIFPTQDDVTDFANTRINPLIRETGHKGE